MDVADSCIVCDNKRLQRLPATIAPFIANRVWKIGQFKTHLDHCPKCDAYFYEIRLDDKENERLYHDYRGREYVEQRHHFEHYYTEELNDLVENNEKQITNRKTNAARILCNHLPFNKVRAVLDYGGDRGQYIIDELAGADRYVYDLSDVEPLDGMIKLKSLDDCRKHDYDLIMCCQVLEHVAYPRKVLRDIWAMCNNDSLLYIEVPNEAPNRAGKVYRWRQNLNLLARNPLIVIDAIRLFSGPRFMMHEHVNYFNPVSVQKLLSNAGFVVQEITVKQIDCGWTTTDNICCVAKRR